MPFPKTISPHLTIWALYAFVGILLFINLSRAPALENGLSSEFPPPVPSAPELSHRRRIPWKYFLLFWVLFPATSALASFVKPPAIVVILLSWGVGILVGLVIIVHSICAPGKIYCCVKHVNIVLQRRFSIPNRLWKTSEIGLT